MSSSEIFKSLERIKKLSEESRGLQIKDLINSTRLKRLSVHNDLVSYDYSKQRITQKTLDNLFLLPDLIDLKNKIKSLSTGDFMNNSEKRRVEHLLLRNTLATKEVDEGHATIIREQMKFKDFVVNLTSSQPKIKSIVSIGIGGSRLGPDMLSEAFSKNNNINIYYSSSYDLIELKNILSLCDPKSTLIFTLSKSFKTPEVIDNSLYAREWMEKELGSKARNNIYGVSSNSKEMTFHGIPKSNQFSISNSIGGRFSIWSSISISAAIDIGWKDFSDFLLGASMADKHFLNNPWEENIPVIMALMNLWNTNGLNINNLGIFVYDFRIRSLPKYLSQLGMESNGKSYNSNNNVSPFHTSPLIWGSYGPEAQHSVFQWIQQGTYESACDFIGIKDDENIEQHNASNFALFSQIMAISLGEDNKEPYKSIKGNNPISLFQLQELSPKNLGYLLACYENKVFVEGLLLGIDSFDQWGVELGKKLYKKYQDDPSLLQSYFHESLLKKKK